MADIRDEAAGRVREVGLAAALTGGAIAGLVLLAVCVAAAVSTVAAGLGLLLIPLVAVAVRELAGRYRGVAGRRLGTPVPAPYLPRPSFTAKPGPWPLRQAALTRWIVTDRATWRDVAWLPLGFLLGVPLAAAAPLLVLYGLVGVFLPITYPLIDQQVGTGTHYLFIPVTSTAMSLVAVPIGAGVAGLGLWIAPALLDRHARLTRALLGPTREQLERRLERVTETRSEAVDTSAADLRRIERDLHDGVQVRLLSLGMNLTAIQRLMREDPGAAEALLLETKENSGKALNELRDLVRGIHPPVLADRGLADAVRAFAMDLPLRTEVDIELPGRAPAPVESAVYFAISESLTNVLKHARAKRADVRLRYERGVLRAEVTDDGVGGAEPADGSGLRGVERRLGAFDGVVAISSPPGGPTIVVMEVPCALS
ncbi:sensor histidine kinase [Actinomadura algeriensis]|uniref:histidine kinase n=1 Tax=Actinomadura algeriensis TaxID=1679523 RepID=A0ABR9JTK3_9ACTN|nr:sensor histidine kinase [Actinomadura algeriensis]MBE1533906.1 signal transduction histidine kinase [Actinomadura algeriensis]